MKEFLAAHHIAPIGSETYQVVPGNVICCHERFESQKDILSRWLGALLCTIKCVLEHPLFTS